MNEPTKSLLLIGYGNALRSDDGIGPQVVERLGQETSGEQIALITAHQLLPEHAEPISRAARVIFVDTSALAPPGEISVRAINAHSTADAWLIHDFTPQTILAYAKHLYGHAPPATLITVNGFSFEHGDALSPQMAQIMPQILRRVRDVIMKDAQ